MKCNICGQKNQISAKFCASCGSQLPKLTEQEISGAGAGKSALNTKSTTLKAILKIAIPVLALIVLAIAILPGLLKNSNYIFPKGDMVFFILDESSTISIKNNPKITIDGEVNSISYSLDGSKAAVLVNGESETGGELWYLDESGKYKITDNALSYLISASGNGIAYLTDYDFDADTATLYLYDSKSKKATKINDEVFYQGIGLCISPDGKTVGYMTDFDMTNEEFRCFIKRDGKKAEGLGKNELVLILADDAKYIYYAKIVDSNLGSLYVKKGKNETKLISDLSSVDIERLFINYNHTQLLFSYEGKAYLSRDGKEKEKIYNSEVNDLVIPQYVQVRRPYNRMDIVTYGIKSFTDVVMATDDNKAFYIDNKLETMRLPISANTNIFSVAISGKDIVFLDSSRKLCRLDLAKPDADKNVIAEDVLQFKASPDGKFVCFLNCDDELWCVNGNSKPKKIADDVETFIISNSGNSVFFLSDYFGGTGTLYYSRNGRKKEKVKDGDDVCEVISTACSVYYIIDYNGDAEVYRSNGNEKFTKFEEDVQDIMLHNK